jgi:hypothetical protein
MKAKILDHTMKKCEAAFSIGVGRRKVLAAIAARKTNQRL